MIYFITQVFLLKLKPTSNQVTVAELTLFEPPEESHSYISWGLIIAVQWKTCASDFGLDKDILIDEFSFLSLDCAFLWTSLLKMHKFNGQTQKALNLSNSALCMSHGVMITHLFCSFLCVYKKKKQNMYVDMYRYRYIFESMKYDKDNFHSFGLTHIFCFRLSNFSTGRWFPKTS